MWGQWTQWSTCPATCGGIYTQTRMRTCSMASNGGQTCAPPQTQSRQCGRVNSGGVWRQNRVTC